MPGFSAKRSLASTAAAFCLAALLCPACGAGQPAQPGKEDVPVNAGKWQSIGLSGGGAMFTPAISPHDPNLMLLNCDMSAAYRSTDGGRNWEMLHWDQLLSSTRCRPVFHPTDPNTVFSVHGWSGRLRVSRDRGATWSDFAEALPEGVCEIAIDPSNPNLMLVGYDNGAFVSKDGGATWRRGQGLRGEVVGFHFDQTSLRASRRCFAGTTQGVFRSADGGLTWEQFGSGLPGKELRSFAGGSNKEKDLCVLYCTVEGKTEGGQYQGGVYRSTDRGKTWQQAMGPEIATTGGRRAPQYRWVLTTNVQPLRVYAATEEGGRVYRSDDGGRHWQETLFRTVDSGKLNIEPHYLTCETGGWGENNSGININPADPDNVIVTDWMCCHITRDGGNSWISAQTRRAEGQGEPAKGQRWVDNGLVVTTVWHYYIDPFQHNRHYIAYTDIGYARSEDAGKTWYWQTGEPLRNTTYEIAFDPAVPGKMWAAFADLHDIPNMNVISGRHYFDRAGGGVGISEDFGVTWRDTSTGLPGKPVTSVVLDPNSPKNARVLYASCFEGGVYKSTDGGKIWAAKSTGLGSVGKNLRTCRLILHQDGTLFVLITAPTMGSHQGTAGAGLYRSRDGGGHWELITQSHPLHWPKDFDVDPRDSKVLYLGAGDWPGFDEGGLYKTSDGGKSWNLVARKGPEAFGATINPKRPDWVYLCLTEGAPGVGLWLSKDGGATWAPFRDLPFRNIQRVTFDLDDDSVIYLSTFGGSVWKGPAEP